MSETATKLLEQVLQLPELEREMIAAHLWERASEAGRQQLLDARYDDPEVRALLEERLKEVDEHPKRLLDGEQVMAELRARVKRMGQQ